MLRLLCLLLLTLALAQPETDLELYGLQGAVRTVAVYTSEGSNPPALNARAEFTRTGETLWFESYFEGTLWLRGESRFDAQGRKLETLRYNADGSLDYRYVYLYEGENLLEEQGFSADTPEVMTFRRRYLYEGGVLLEMQFYEPTNSLRYRITYSYDDTGRLVGGATDGEAGNSRFEYRYNSDGTRQEALGYGEDDSLRSRRSYTYDSFGHLILTRDVRYGNGGETTSTESVVYTPDDFGNPIQQVGVLEGVVVLTGVPFRFQETTVREIVYY